MKHDDRADTIKCKVSVWCGHAVLTNTWPPMNDLGSELSMVLTAIYYI